MNKLKIEDDIDAYTVENVFFVPEEARWQTIASAAHTPEIGIIIDKAMTAIERENKSLKDVLPKNYTCFVYNAPDFLSGAFEFFMKINFVKFFLGIFQSILLLQTNAFFIFLRRQYEVTVQNLCCMLHCADVFFH